MSAKGKSACGHPNCGASQGICESLTFGRGHLDEHGYWQIPCAICARDHERRFPESGACWPFDVTKQVKPIPLFKKGEKVNLYLISSKYGYDKYLSAVVLAGSEEEARDLHPNGSGKVPWDNPSFRREWESARDQVTVRYLGEFTPVDDREGYVLTSEYNEG